MGIAPTAVVDGAAVAAPAVSGGLTLSLQPVRYTQVKGLVDGNELDTWIARGTKAPVVYCTVIVIFSENNGGSCGSWSSSPSNSCNVCLPGGRSSTVSVSP